MPPKSPSPQYDFILKDQPKQRAPLLSGGNRLVLILGTALILFILIIIIGAVVSKGGGKTSGMVDIMARAQEIDRVTKVQESNLKDPSVINLAATTDTVLSSEQAQLSKYLASHNVKPDKKKLSAYQSSSTDSRMAGAQQANNLDTSYTNYLRTSLSAYAQAIKTTYNQTSSTDARSILQTAYTSTNVLLESTPLKNQ